MKPVLCVLLAILSLSLPSPRSFADDAAAPNQSDHEKHHPKEKALKEPSPEMRKKMADMHQMMADCLRSDKPIADCKKEMREHCPMMKDGHHCPMMGEMGM